MLAVSKKVKQHNEAFKILFPFLCIFIKKKQKKITRVVKKINGQLSFMWISKMNKSYDVVECGMLHQIPF